MKANSRIIALLIAAISIISFAGCNSDVNDDISSVPNTSINSYEPEYSSEPSVEESSTIHSNYAPITSNKPTTNNASQNSTALPKPHTHAYGEWKTTKQSTCTTTGTKERYCSCGNKESQSIAKADHSVVKDTAVVATCTKTGLTEGSHCSICNIVIQKQNIIDKVNHNYNSGICVSCGISDPNYKTPDLTLGEYIEKNGIKQEDGQYAISKTTSSENISGMLTKIYWDPAKKSLLFAEQSTTSTGTLIAGILFEYGSNQQRITVVNQVISSKFTGIGYIYADTYSISNDTIQWLNCECTYQSLIPNNKKTAETAVWLLMSHTSDFLRELNIGVDLRDLGFVKWIG